MYFNILSADYIQDYLIKFRFNNGKSGIIDFEKYIENGELFIPIRLKEKFRIFEVQFGAITWENGEIDIAPEKIYEMATGEKIIFPESSISATRQLQETHTRPSSV